MSFNGVFRRLVAAAAGAGALLSAVAAPPARAGVDGEILYAHSTDGGATWAGRANLSADADKSETSHVAAEAGAVHVVWKEGDDGEVVYRRSLDSGSTFAAEANITGTPGDSAEPDVSIDGPAVHVPWAEAIGGDVDGVYLRSSADGGATFGDRTEVSEDRGLKSKDPSLTSEGAVLAIVYEQEVSPDREDIVFHRSPDGGRKWGDALNLSGDAEKSTEPVVGADGDAVHVVWEARGEDLNPGDDRVGYSGSTDGGATFTPTVRLPSDVALEEPAVGAAGGVVHVVSCSPTDETGVAASDLWYYRSADGGITWAPPVDLSPGPGGCDNAKLALSGPDVYVAWAESTEGRHDILVRHSADGGTTFAAAGNVSGTAGDSEDPSIAVDPASGAVHITWTDSSAETPGPAPAPALAPGSATPAVRRRPAGA